MKSQYIIDNKHIESASSQKPGNNLRLKVGQSERQLFCNKSMIHDEIFDIIGKRASDRPKSSNDLSKKQLSDLQ